MSRDIYCIGLVGDSEEYRRHARVVEACFNAGCKCLPEETAKFFGHNDPDPALLLESLTIDSETWAHEWADEHGDQFGYDVEVAEIPPSVKVVRFGVC